MLVAYKGVGTSAIHVLNFGRIRPKFDSNMLRVILMNCRPLSCIAPLKLEHPGCERMVVVIAGCGSKSARSTLRCSACISGIVNGMVLSAYLMRHRSHVCDPDAFMQRRKNS
jgi:hypothetical protein